MQKTKPRTKAQEFASARNWAKLRLKGSLPNVKIGLFSSDELRILESMYSLRDRMLANWDKTTKELRAKQKERT